jgi:Homeodomain-like domain-containing protein
MRRNDSCLYLAPDDRVRLQALAADRNTPRKLVWRAEIVLATADGHDTNQIVRRARTSKPTVWRWQERYLDEGGVCPPVVEYDTAFRVQAAKEVQQLPNASAVVEMLSDFSVVRAQIEGCRKIG